MKNTIYNAKIILTDRIIERGYLVFENDTITEIGEGAPLSLANGIDAEGKYLSPGFVDIHCHGGADYDFADGTDEAYLIPARLHAEHGTTSIVPTITTCPTEDAETAFDIFHRVKNVENNGARFLGIHMEGPYVSPEEAGAQDYRYIRPPSPEDWENFLSKAQGAIIRWTFAPELENSVEFVKALKKEGVTLSIGHTRATLDEVEACFKSGCELLTHFYSSMSGITRRDGYRILGTIEAGYYLEGMNVELICDGHHMPSKLLRIIYNAKGADRIALVTDAMRGAGMGEGKTVLGNRKTGLECIVEGGVAKLPDRTSFAGSVATSDVLLRTMYKKTGISLVDTVKMASTTPARLIGKGNELGRIEVGYKADLTLFDEDINVSMTLVNGKKVYEKK